MKLYLNTGLTVDKQYFTLLRKNIKYTSNSSKKAK